MRGLDPRINLKGFLLVMDCQVKPGNDTVEQPISRPP
jgi:hypothetical protein